MISTAEKEAKPYSRSCKIAKAQRFPSIENDYGLLLEEPGRYYAIAAELEYPVTCDGERPLIIQYEVKYEREVNCSGAYLKLIVEEEDLDTFDDNTPYSILFGPDVCGPKDQVRSFHLRDQVY